MIWHLRAGLSAIFLWDETIDLSDKMVERKVSFGEPKIHFLWVFSCMRSKSDVWRCDFYTKF